MTELTDTQYAIADAIGEFLRGKGAESFNASQLARAAKCTTREVYPVLDWMADSSYIDVTGRGGKWVRYSEHTIGRVNRR